MKTVSNPASSAVGDEFGMVGRRLRAPVSELKAELHSRHAIPAFICPPLDPWLKPFLEPVLLDAVTASQSSPVQIDTHEPPLSAPLRLSFDYTRSVGPLLSQFFTELRERRVVGVRGSDGRVLRAARRVSTPSTYEPLTEVVPVASVGTVLSWTWQDQPLEGQPLDRPFAWALIKLDGADTPLLHAVDAGSADAISTGARVHVHWADEPVGAITDIAYFALGDTAEDVPEEGADDREPVTMLVTPSAIEIQHTASLPESTFLRGLEEGKLVGATPSGQRREGEGVLPCARSGSGHRSGSSPSSSSCPTRAR